MGIGAIVIAACSLLLSVVSILLAMATYSDKYFERVTVRCAAGGDQEMPSFVTIYVSNTGGCTISIEDIIFEKRYKELEKHLPGHYAEGQDSNATLLGRSRDKKLFPVVLDPGHGNEWKMPMEQDKGGTPVWHPFIAGEGVAKIITSRGTTVTLRGGSDRFVSKPPSWDEIIAMVFRRS